MPRIVQGRARTQARMWGGIQKPLTSQHLPLGGKAQRKTQKGRVRETGKELAHLEGRTPEGAERVG